jgi:hypothetical protein
MSSVLLTLGVILLVVVGLILGVGRGNWRRGARRLVRRVRTLRRRRLAPVLGRLRGVLATAWTRTPRRRVSAQLRRVADRVERVGAASGEFVRARADLSRDLSHLEDITVVGPPPQGGRPTRGQKPTSSRDWLVAAAMGLAGMVVAAANVWLLTELILPYLPQSVMVERTITIPLAVSSLAYVFGLAYFALGASEGPGSRIFQWATGLLIAMLAVAQGLAVVSALDGRGIATATWWGGIAVAGFLGLAGALIPAIIAASAHAAIDRFEKWLSARGVREARTALGRQHETSERLRETLDKMEDQVTAVRAELGALAQQGAGRLLLTGDAATVERATLVLDRLARKVETDPEAPADGDLGAVRIGLGLLRDLLALAVWLLAAAFMFTVVLPSMDELGTGSLLLSAAIIAGIGVLLVVGAILRWILAEVPIERATSLRGALVLVTGLAAVALGAALGPAAAAAGALETTGLQASGWLALLVLVGAVASARLQEGVSAVGSLVTALLAGAAWIVLAAANLVLAGFDVLLTGYRGRRDRGVKRSSRRRESAGRLGSSRNRS